MSNTKIAKTAATRSTVSAPRLPAPIALTPDQIRRVAGAGGDVPTPTKPTTTCGGIRVKA